VVKRGGKAKTITDKFDHPFLTKDMVKDMSHIVLKLIVLKRAEKGKVYPYELITELSKGHAAGFMKKFCQDPKNDIYNTMNALEKSGYIKAVARIDGGRLKKYYTITKDGKDALRNAKTHFGSAIKGIVGIIGR